MSEVDRPIAFCSIFPKIGIARLGDSAEYFIGPESPGVEVDPEGGFKDAYGQVKRQAAKFRIYAFDDAGAVIAELTSKNGKCGNQWLADTKGHYHVTSKTAIVSRVSISLLP